MSAYRYTIYVRRLDFFHCNEVMRQTSHIAVSRHRDTHSTFHQQTPSFRRSIRATPRVELPAPVKAALGGRLNYTEHGSFDGRLFRWQVVVDAMPERIRLDGTIEVIAEGAGCKRKDQATIQVDLFGVRGAVERVFEASTRDNWSKAATYTQRWLATHP